jgi:hypothetical protein
VLLALLVGCTAWAGSINVSGAITGGQATEGMGGGTASITFSGLGFSGQLGGSTTSIYTTAPPFSPSSSGGSTVLDALPEETAFQNTGGVGYNLNGINFICNASYFGNCGMRMTINYVFSVPDLSNEPLGTDIVNGWFTANVMAQAGDPTNVYNGGFSGSGTATFTLSGFSPSGGPPTEYFLQGAVFNFVAVPEPSSITLGVLGLAAFALARVLRLRSPLRTVAALFTEDML